jgi:hypothetical protein
MKALIVCEPDEDVSWLKRDPAFGMISMGKIKKHKKKGKSSKKNKNVVR